MPPMSGCRSTTRHRAVVVDVDARRSSLAADVEPEAGGHAAALVRAVERRLVVRVRLRAPRASRPCRSGRTSGRRRALVPSLAAFLRRNSIGSMPSLLGQISSIDALDGERRVRRAGRAIGRDLGPVDDDVVAVDRGRWRCRSRRRRTCTPGRPASPGRRPPRTPATASAATMRAVLLGADLDPDVRARGRAGGAEHLLAGHHHLHRPAGLLRQRERQRLEVDDGLAAEAAADLGRRDA